MGRGEVEERKGEREGWGGEVVTENFQVFGGGNAKEKREREKRKRGGRGRGGEEKGEERGKKEKKEGKGGKNMGIFDDIKLGLDKGSKYEKGNLKAKKTQMTMLPLETVTPD